MASWTTLAALSVRTALPLVPPLPVRTPVTLAASVAASAVRTLAAPVVAPATALSSTLAVWTPFGTSVSGGTPRLTTSVAVGPRLTPLAVGAPLRTIAGPPVITRGSLWAPVISSLVGSPPSAVVARAVWTPVPAVGTAVAVGTPFVSIAGGALTAPIITPLVGTRTASIITSLPVRTGAPAVGSLATVR